MLETRRINIGKGHIRALAVSLLSKNLVLLKGSKGFIMCGYLNLRTAERFKDAAVKIVGVSTISEALKAKVHSCTRQALRLGIYKGQPVREALRIIV